MRGLSFVGAAVLLGSLSLGFVSSPAAAADLRVALSGDLAPLHHKKGERFEGFEVELAQLLAKKLKRRLVVVDLAALEKGSFDAVGDRDVDLSLNSVAASSTAPPELALTQPYATLHFALAGKKGRLPNDLSTSELRVGVLDRDSRSLLRTRMPEAHFVPQSSIRGAIAALMRGQVDLVAHDRAVLTQAIAGTQLQVFAPSLGDMPLAMVVPAAERDRYDRLLAKLAKPIAALQQKWLEAGGPATIEDPLAELPRNWVELSWRKGKLVIPVYCQKATTRIEISKAGGGYTLVFNMGEDSIEGHVRSITKVGPHHYRLTYLTEHIELKYKPGSATAQWGKSTELWKGAWRTFADAEHESKYRAVRVQRCKK